MCVRIHVKVSVCVCVYLRKCVSHRTETEREKASACNSVQVDCSVRIYLSVLSRSQSLMNSRFEFSPVLWSAHSIVCLFVVCVARESRSFSAHGECGVPPFGAHETAEFGPQVRRQGTKQGSKGVVAVVCCIRVKAWCITFVRRRISMFVCVCQRTREVRILSCC